MPRKQSVDIQLTAEDQTLLGRWNKVWPLRKALRADIVFRAARGQTNYMIAKELGISRNTVKKWRYRFALEGIAGLKSRPIPGRPKRIAVEAWVLAAADSFDKCFREIVQLLNGLRGT